MSSNRRVFNEWLRPDLGIKLNDYHAIEKPETRHIFRTPLNFPVCIEIGWIYAIDINFAL
jgi:hypothetical protein